MSLILAKGVRKSFGSFEAVRGVDLRVEPGQVVGLLGANGAGKTTLMRCLLGLYAPSAGRVELFGGPPDMASRARIGYVPQQTGLYPDLTPAENIEFAASAYGFDPARVSDGDRALLGSLPAGRQRRLAFEIALAHDPEVLVLDEPTSGVGPAEAAELWDVVGDQAARGVGVLVTTHNMSEASQCDWLEIMVDGQIAARGTVGDVVGGTTVVEIDSPSWQRIFEQLSALGLPVTLAGRRVRVVDVRPSDLPPLPDATVRQVPATIEERMTVLAKAHP